MKSRSEIWLRALEELGAQCSASTARDAQTFERRLKQEGDTFLTVTLPAFAKQFERSLADESISSYAFPGWGRQKGRIIYSESGVVSKVEIIRGNPEFLGDFLDLVFEDSISVGLGLHELEESGIDTDPRIRHANGADEASKMARAIAAVRQLTLMFSKEKVLCTEALQQKAIAEYIETDKMLEDPLLDSRSSTLFGGRRLDDTRKVLRIAFGNALSKTDGDIYHGTLTPKHGPGSTADSLYGNQKWTFPTWHDRLETLFPYGRYALPGFQHSWKYSQVKHLAPKDEPPVKVQLVPKTQLSPRLIAIEPTCMQYMQQAISTSLVDALEDDFISQWFVGFTDQRPNNHLAQIGSLDGSLATLDLSEASDRIANWVVEDLYADFPHFLEGIDACRSTRAQLPNGDIINLQKFASMGSAMTFPLEAITFASVVIERTLHSMGRPITKKNILALRGLVRIYGDDIIVPTECAVSVAEGLEVFGFKVNRNKSFWTGKFRESCGKEFWNGYDVSIVKFRTAIPTARHHASEVISTVSTRNQLYKAGLKRTASLMDSGLTVLLNGNFPIVQETSPILGRIDDSIPYDIHGFDQSLQSPFVKGYVVKSTTPVNGIDDLEALMKVLSQNSELPNPDERHLTHSGRPRVVSIKLVRARPF